MDPKTVWNRYFGHTGFRPGQETLIDGILFGRDVMGIMPTGGGKSVCYQIPALLLPGTTLAISPPISLMKDQVTALRESNISAVFLSSSYVGAALIVRVLRGSRDLRIRELGLEELSTFGLLKETSRGLVDQYIDRLVEQELLIEAAHSTLRTTHKAAAVLFLGEQVTMLTRMETGRFVNAGAGWNTYKFREPFDGVPSVVCQALNFQGWVEIKNVTTEGFLYCLRKPNFAAGKAGSVAAGSVTTGQFYTASGTSSSSAHAEHTLVSGVTLPVVTMPTLPTATLTTTANQIEIHYMAIEYGGDR